MIKNDELGDQAYRELKKLIVSGRLAPGEKIVQEKIAAKLGISRTPLRVALQMLEAENLIEPKSKVGFQVKQIDNSEILEIFDCRIALESTAAALLATSISQKDAQKLETFLESFSKGVDNDNYKKTDVQFHNFIVEKCGNSFLGRLFRQGNLIIYIEQIGLIRPAEETIQEHFDIVRAIINRDPDNAEKTMKTHLLNSRKVIEEDIKMRG
jgi:DNA-binding GntR family transcriptional regulator